MYLTTLVTWKIRRELFCIWAAELPWAKENTDWVSGWFLNILEFTQSFSYLKIVQYQLIDATCPATKEPVSSVACAGGKEIQKQKRKRY